MFIPPFVPHEHKEEKKPESIENRVIDDKEIEQMALEAKKLYEGNSNLMPTAVIKSIMSKNHIPEDDYAAYERIYRRFGEKSGVRLHLPHRPTTLSPSAAHRIYDLPKGKPDNKELQRPRGELLDDGYNLDK